MALPPHLLPPQPGSLQTLEPSEASMAREMKLSPD